MTEKQKDKGQPTINRKAEELPMLDSATLWIEDKNTKINIEVRNSMPAVPNRNRDDNGSNKDEP